MKSLDKFSQVVYQYQRLVLAGVMLLVAAVGIYLLRASNAAAPAISAEPELGVVTGPAAALSDASASGGKYVKFGPAIPTPPPVTPPTPPPPPPTASDPTIAIVGDIVYDSGTAYEQTAALVKSDPSIQWILVAGDLAYQNGSTADFARWKASGWGALDAKIKPSPGNHEYNTAGGSGYYAYWKGIAPYYSFDIGNWHILSLNSQESHGAGSAQDIWMKNDLAAHSNKCSLAYEHYPRFSGGSSHGSDSGMQPLWQTMYDASGDIFVAAHDHHYQRFGPQTPGGVADAGKGIVSWIVGTGGAALKPAAPGSNSQKVITNTYGILKMTLHPANYDFKFVGTGGAVLDSGSGSCH